eukprot:TRINITY_DN384_c0_g1_i12.p2 TRINITY_DN384_c0_g1~~TRINITY_DN384_c0_g1_i12.p2  ORF type:complete len:200 (-),score=-8.82 TRINITY_DN384_c0_g1_i12:200-799(-)
MGATQGEFRNVTQTQTQICTYVKKDKKSQVVKFHNYRLCLSRAKEFSILYPKKTFYITFFVVIGELRFIYEYTFTQLQMKTSMKHKEKNLKYAQLCENLRNFLLVSTMLIMVLQYIVVCLVNNREQDNFTQGIFKYCTGFLFNIKKNYIKCLPRIGLQIMSQLESYLSFKLWHYKLFKREDGFQVQSKFRVCKQYWSTT